MHSQRRRLAAILIASLTLIAGLVGVATPASAANRPGVDWVARNSTQDVAWDSVVFGNGVFVALANNAPSNAVMTSPDGVTWTGRATPGVGVVAWFSVTFGNGLFVAVSTAATGQEVMTSPNGINWTLRNTPPDGGWNAVTYGNGLFVAVSSSGTGQRVMTSPDGITWTSRNTPADYMWQSVTYGGGKFVAVAVNGVSDGVMTSPNGIDWTLRTAAAPSSWFSVTYGNGTFVAVAIDLFGQLVMTSPDGVTWTAPAAPQSCIWSSVTYGGGQFVAVGPGGAGYVMTSPDGTTWTVQTTPNDNGWNAVTYAQGLFVAVGGAGAGNRIITSGVFGSAPTIGSVSITGTKAIGEKLRAKTTGVTGTPTPTVSYQWQSSTDKGPWTNIRRATTANFTVPVSLNGQRIRVIATATNGIDPNGSKTSAAVAIATSAEPTPVKNVDGTAKGLNITMTWDPATAAANAPILSYETRCARGDSVVRESASDTARRATLKVTEVGLWVCRVAAVNAVGRSSTTPVKINVK